MQGTGHRFSMCLLILLLALSACAAPASSTPSPSPIAATPSRSPMEMTAAPTTVPGPSATPAPSATGSADPRPTSEAVAVGAVAETTIDGLRVRSEPRVADDSFKQDPLLPLGTPLYVLDGPVSASGYEWLEVAPLSSRSLPQGWVAVRSRTGERWLAPGTFACPPKPTDFRSLAALPPAVGLACFPRTSITVVARLIGCNCDVDGGSLSPAWFSTGTGSGEMLVEPGRTRPPDDVRDWFWLSLDPAGEHPPQLPLGEVVEVTGVFAHPAAMGCTLTAMDGEPVASSICRLTFAVGTLERNRP
jgi:hypothetical protein